MQSHCQEDPIFAKYKRLNEALVGVVEDYSLVSFTALSVKVSIASCLHYVFTPLHSLVETMNYMVMYILGWNVEEKNKQLIVEA